MKNKILFLLATILSIAAAILISLLNKNTGIPKTWDMIDSFTIRQLISAFTIGSPVIALIVSAASIQSGGFKKTNIILLIFSLCAIGTTAFFIIPLLQEMNEFNLAIRANIFSLFLQFIFFYLLTGTMMFVIWSLGILVVGLLVFEFLLEIKFFDAIKWFGKKVIWPFIVKPILYVVALVLYPYKHFRKKNNTRYN